jgi:hypothetical protein
MIEKLQPALPLIFATAMYLWQAYEYAKLKEPYDVLIFFGYVCANVGFVLKLATR